MVKVLCVLLFIGASLSFASNVKFVGTSQAPRVPVEKFSPSNVETVDFELIKETEFFSAQRCANCHQDVYKAWQQSLHRNAAREPFYRESADILLNTRGIEFTRHCESCHTPVALVSGKLSAQSGLKKAPFTVMDDEGVSCVICHSITRVRPQGTGSYTIRQPAMLVRADGSLVTGDVSNEQILSNIEDHKRAMMHPIMQQPEFCAVCHKVTAPPSLNGYKQILGFSVYDEWQASAASTESVQSFYPRQQRIDCRGCHMPKVASDNDYASKEGQIALHRWPGANVAVPMFYGYDEQVEVTREFLQKQVLEIDIFGLRVGENSDLKVLDTVNELDRQGGKAVTVRVVVSNRNAAHSFPPEVRDLYEAWVEFEAIDEQGEIIYRSGYIKPDNTLDEKAHVYKAIILDSDGRPITRHQIWLTTVKAYDNAIEAGRSDVVRYGFNLPQSIEGKRIKLRAKLNYRRFNQEYTNYVLGRHNLQMELPIVEMATRETTLMFGKNVESHKVASWKRYNDYAIGMMQQANYGEATQAFEQAAKLNSKDSNLWVNVAIAQMRTERFGYELEQLRSAEKFLEKALELNPYNLRAKYVRALVYRGLGNGQKCVSELQAIVEKYPRDREVLKQLGASLQSLGQLQAAEQAFEAALKIEPNDSSIYKNLAAIYEANGQREKAKQAQQLYLEWREDPIAQVVAQRFYQANTGWNEERNPGHIHSEGSATRGVVTGLRAASIDSR